MNRIIAPLSPALALMILLAGSSVAFPASAPQDDAAEQTERSRVPRTRALDPVVLALPEVRPLDELEASPLYTFHEGEVDAYLKALAGRDLGYRERLVHLARKNLGQPYEIFCLGEFPYELHDPDPLYRLDRSDCVTFVEQMYAMAFSADWQEFLPMLLKIRYAEGVIGVATRNHYTEADWNPHNAWLFEDITAKLGVPTEGYRMKVDRARNLEKQFGVITNIPVEIHHERFIPASALKDAYPRLQDGDVVEVVRGKGEGRWVGHVGLFVRNAAGEPCFLHSSKPRVKEESLPGYIERSRGRVLGLKFLRLRPALRK